MEKRFDNAYEHGLLIQPSCNITIILVLSRGFRKRIRRLGIPLALLARLEVESSFASLLTLPMREISLRTKTVFTQGVKSESGDI